MKAQPSVSLSLYQTGLGVASYQDNSPCGAEPQVHGREESYNKLSKRKKIKPAQAFRGFRKSRMATPNHRSYHDSRRGWEVKRMCQSFPLSRTHTFVRSFITMLYYPASSATHPSQVPDPEPIIIHPSIHPTNHLYIFLRLSRVRLQGQQPKRKPRLPSP